MAKKIIKEIIIMLLLTLAIILILGILLYDYVPNSKVMPEPVAYSTPENVKQEILESAGVDENQVILTYEIDATDLKNDKKVNNYKTGKSNPFSSYETTTSEGGNNTSSGTSTGTGNNINENTSGNKFSQDKGTK